MRKHAFLGPCSHTWQVAVQLGCLRTSCDLPLRWRGSSPPPCCTGECRAAFTCAPRLEAGTPPLPLRPRLSLDVRVPLRAYTTHHAMSTYFAPLCSFSLHLAAWLLRLCPRGCPSGSCRRLHSPRCVTLTPCLSCRLHTTERTVAVTSVHLFGPADQPRFPLPSVPYRLLSPPPASSLRRSSRRASTTKTRLLDHAL